MQNLDEPDDSIDSKAAPMEICLVEGTFLRSPDAFDGKEAGKGVQEHTRPGPQVRTFMMAYVLVLLGQLPA